MVQGTAKGSQQKERGRAGRALGGASVQEASIHPSKRRGGAVVYGIGRVGRVGGRRGGIAAAAAHHPHHAADTWTTSCLRGLRLASRC